MASRSDTVPDTDALFKLPPAEFTAARNALATRLKKSGRAEDAERVKTLPKPSVSAWAVNQLYWQHRKHFDRLVAVGERFRKAQASQLAGKSADLRGTLDERRESLSELSKLAAEALRTIGHAPTPDMMRRITTTLEAIATYGAVPEAPPAGRLVDDVEPPGFEALAALVPRIGESGREDGEPSKVLPFRQERQERAAKKRAASKDDEHAREEERKAQRTKASAAVRDAERTLADARKTAERAEAALKKAAARTREVDKVRAEAELKLEKATAEANEARQLARSVAADAEQAAQAVEDAERALEKAKKELDGLSD